MEENRYAFHAGKPLRSTPGAFGEGVSAPLAAKHSNGEVETSAVVEATLSERMHMKANPGQVIIITLKYIE